MVSLDDADVVAVQVQSEAVELFEFARHAAVARHETVSQQVLVNSRVGEVTAQSLVIERVVAQRRRVRVQVGVGQVEVKVLLRPPRLQVPHITDKYSIVVVNVYKRHFEF